MRRDAKKRRRWTWWLVAAAVLLFIVYSAIPKPVEVRAATVREGELELVLSTTGVVEGEVTDISARITARVISLLVDEGDVVTRGQVLAQLESTDIESEVARLEAAVQGAQEEVAALERRAGAETGQLQAAAARARANVQAARESLRELQAGTRAEEIATQRAVLNQARAQAEDARRRYERAQQLFGRGAISAQELDTARTSYESARANVQAQEQTLQALVRGPRSEQIAAARAQVRAAEAALREAESALGLVGARRSEVAAARSRLQQARAAVQSAQAQLAFTTIRSPIGGVVARRHAEVGETLTPREAIYTVANPDRIWVIAEVDEEDVAAVAVGQRVTISIDAYPDRESVGRVTRVSQIAEPRDVGRVRAKVVRTRIDIAESDIPLRPGMEVNITGRLPTGRTTLLLPNDAVVTIGEEDVVHVIEDSTVRRRTVETGQSNFEYIQILSGLQEGDQVAVTNLDDLTNGRRVRVVD